MKKLEQLTSFLYHYLQSYVSFSANAPSPYLPSTPGGQPPMTPSSAYLPGTPGGQPMTPGGGGLDMMSPVVGNLSPSCQSCACSVGDLMLLKRS